MPPLPIPSTAPSIFRLPALAALLALLVVATSPAHADTLSSVKSRGELRCGVNGEVPGLSLVDDAGNWSGLDVDFCRAVAAAVLGSAEKVRFVPLSTAERLAAVRDGDVDVLSRNTSWTARRDLNEDISFAGVLYYDGQGFMVPRDSGLMSTLELSDAVICAVADTTSADNARRYFTRHRMSMDLKLHPDLSSAKDAYLDGQCTTLTTDRSQLFGLRTTLEQPQDHRILPEVVSKEPLGPAVREDDIEWLKLVRWTLFTLIAAEELGINSSNVDNARTRATSYEVRTLLDLDRQTSEALGIKKEWGYRVIRQVGNYGEIFERNLGATAGLAVKRGLNALWSDGGLLYAPPTR
ncbi:MAG: amino acid ABC transporter substrate-binding protein [Thiohalocapsa sp.]|jgi:general L-amino acid transport system substrate-binding protein